MVPKFCRLAWRVEKMDRFTDELGELIGTEFFTPGFLAELYPDADFKVMFGEHGIEPIQPGPGGLEFGEQGGRLIEIAIDVADAEAVRAKLEGAGYKPTAVSHLPVPDVDEYLFGRDFHGVPLLVCTQGVNEQQIRSERPFAYLEEAAPPKVARVTLAVDDLDAVAADLKRFHDMDFVEADPAGFGRRAAVGRHRVKLVEGPSELLDGVERPLVSVDLLHRDVEGAKQKLAAAGFRPRHTRSLSSGGDAYYFGPTVEGLPITLFPETADAELLEEAAS